MTQMRNGQRKQTSPGDAGKEPRHHERDKSKLIDVEANQRSPNIIVADCYEPLPSGLSDHAMHEEKAKRNVARMKKY